MRVYLAGRFSRIDSLNRHRRWIEAAGHKVTSRWLDGGHDGSALAVPEGTPYAKVLEQEITENQRLAMEDWADLVEAEAVICFTEEPRSTNSRGGRHVEMGIALGMGKPVAIVGPRENVFCYLPQTIANFEAWGPEVLEWLTIEAKRAIERAEVEKPGKCIDCGHAKELHSEGRCRQTMGMARDGAAAYCGCIDTLHALGRP